MGTFKLIASTVLAVVVFTVIAACQPASSTTAPSATAAATAGAAGSTAGGTTAVTVKDFALEPKDVTQHGTVSLDVTNQGPTIHNVTIRDDSGKVLAATPDLKTGRSAVLSAHLPAGSYILFCSLPGHESLGIKGRLVVQP